jgi:hypothetical protein
MFSSTILDVAVGLIFVFLAVSLASSAIVEAISGAMKARSATLLRAVKELMNDPELTGLAVQLYQHALINPRNPGATNTADDLSAGPLARLWQAIRLTGQPAADLGSNAPAYIDPKQFAAALTDILHNAKPMIHGDGDSVGNAIDAAVPADANPQINALLHGIARRTGSDLERMRDEIAGWFDNAMDRVSGVYKRWTQRMNFMIALALAVALNISAIHVAKVLWQRPLDTQIVASIANISSGKIPGPEAAFQTMDQLSLPIGWSQYKFGGKVDWADVLEVVVGWLITALAVLFGAPFWFDLLQQVIRLKSSGPSPNEKARGTAAAA